MFKTSFAPSPCGAGMQNTSHITIFGGVENKTKARQVLGTQTRCRTRPRPLRAPPNGYEDTHLVKVVQELVPILGEFKLFINLVVD